MSQKLITLGVLFIVFAVTLLVVFAPSATTSPFSGKSQKTGGTVETIQPRTLALQPEALKLSRRLGGARFTANTRQTLIIQAVLITATEHQDVQIIRSRNGTGERVEIAVAGRSGLLSWDAGSGARKATGALNLAERTLIERLVFDSADEFILAQLRGASYQVIARNLRQDDAGDNYSGPLWDVIRINDPATNEQQRALSKWRLYYLNNSTGLLDKVVSEWKGQRMEATFSGWTERAGEMLPLSITWTSEGQTLMSLSLTNVSLAAN